MSSKRKSCAGCRFWSHLDRHESGAARLCNNENSVVRNQYTSIGCPHRKTGLPEDYVPTAGDDWLTYRSQVVAAGAGDVQINETRLAFIAGAQSAHSSLLKASNLGENAVGQWLALQSAEFQAWIEGIQDAPK